MSTLFAILIAIQLAITVIILFPILFSDFFAILCTILFSIMFASLFANLISFPFFIMIQMLFLNTSKALGQETYNGAITCYFSSHFYFSECMQRKVGRLQELEMMPLALSTSCHHC